MSKQPIVTRIYADLKKAFSGIAEKLYFGRPKTVDSTVISFLSIELPANIQDITTGHSDYVINTTGVVTLYVKAKSDSTLNVNTQTKLAQEVLDRFPINGEVIVASNPTMRSLGFDGYGFNQVYFLFKIRTKMNINNQ